MKEDMSQAQMLDTGELHDYRFSNTGAQAMTRAKAAFLLKERLVAFLDAAWAIFAFPFHAILLLFASYFYIFIHAHIYDFSRR